MNVRRIAIGFLWLSVLFMGLGRATAQAATSPAAAGNSRPAGTGNAEHSQSHPGAKILDGLVKPEQSIPS